MEDLTRGIISGLIIGCVVGLLIGASIEDKYYQPRLQQLGKSICEEEYGMDFESYYDNTLRCKPFTESYDGIKVEIPKTQTSPTS